MPERDDISPDLLERALGRLGIADRPTPTLAGLHAVYTAWCRHIPFDNTWKLIYLSGPSAGRLPGDDPSEFLESWLRFGAGGTCWAGSGALHALLTTLGFQASRTIGTMLAAPRLPPNHGTVVVTIDGFRYLVDTSILHDEPLLLDDRTPTAIAHRAWGVQAGVRDGSWWIHWQPLRRSDGMACRLDRLDVSRATFGEMHEQTRAWSAFNYELYTRSIRGETVVGIGKGQRVERDATGTERQTPLEGDARIRFLVDELGMQEEFVRRLPPDRPTPPPPGSRPMP